MKLFKAVSVALPIEHLKYWDLQRVVFDAGKLHADITAKELWPKAVRISFDTVQSVRIVDEAAYSVSDGEHHFLSRETFAFEIEGDEFFDKVLEYERFVKSSCGLTHYAFLGVNDCLEVISIEKPIFSIIELESCEA